MSVPRPGSAVGPTAGGRSSGRRPRRARWVTLVGVAALLVGALSAHVASGGRQLAPPGVTLPVPAPAAGRSAPAAASAPAPAPMAPDGSFITISGTTDSVASLRGQPTMLWFIVTSCASCAASAPALAQHFRQLTAGGLRVVSLDLYSDLPGGTTGERQLASFAHATTGATATDPAWTWALASRSLSQAYDPAGIPDLYYLLDRDGRVAYEDSVPVSTMTTLLRHAAALTGRADSLRAARHRRPARAGQIPQPGSAQQGLLP